MSLTTARDIAAGYWHTVAARTDGSVVCWGSDSLGQCTVPPEAYDVMQVAAGSSHTVALRSDGIAVAWRPDRPGGLYHAANVPADLGAVNYIAAGENFSIAMESPSCATFGDGDDCDGNGVKDFCDIKSGAADADGDGRLDACEFAAGDLDLDGFVGASDLAALLSAWGSGGKSPADLDRDGAVGGADLAVLLSLWGSVR
jgi:hypothetical protein